MRIAESVCDKECYRGNDVVETICDDKAFFAFEKAKAADKLPAFLLGGSQKGNI